jgi:hypothetical protein
MAIIILPLDYSVPRNYVPTLILTPGCLYIRVYNLKALIRGYLMLRRISLLIPALIIIASSIMMTTNIEQQQLSYAQINQNLSYSL